MSTDAPAPSSVFDESRPPVPGLSADLSSNCDGVVVAAISFSGVEVFSLSANSREEIISLLRASIRLIENASVKKPKRNGERPLLSNPYTKMRSLAERALMLNGNEEP